jgi:hypothetical protein
LGGIALGIGDLTRAADPGAPSWDRFAHWPRFRARLALLAFALLLAASAVAPITAGPSTIETPSAAEALQGPRPGEAKRPRDADLAFYDRVIERIAKGENYYAFIVDEQRRANYPVKPGLAVRLPTLAYLDAWLGRPGQIAAAVLLLLATLAAWWRRLGEEPGGEPHRLWKLAFLYVGISLGLNTYSFVLHELWAGALLALAFALHRPGRWGAALAVAALAVAIREQALPFVLLMGAMAFWRRDWREGAAWTALLALFLAALAIHLQLVSARTLPTDPASDSWLAFRGLSGWLSDVVLSSNLRFLPHWLAGPLVIAAMAGWAGWRSPAGTFGTFLFFGYALAFAVAGRENNFYWGLVIAPTLFLGFAFAPRAARSLWRSALGKT